jgi:hypothetical protein
VRILNLILPLYLRRGAAEVCVLPYKGTKKDMGKRVKDVVVRFDMTVRSWKLVQDE